MSSKQHSNIKLFVVDKYHWAPLLLHQMIYIEFCIYIYVSLLQMLRIFQYWLNIFTHFRQIVFTVHIYIYDKKQWRFVVDFTQYRGYLEGIVNTIMGAWLHREKFALPISHLYYSDVIGWRTVTFPTEVNQHDMAYTTNFWPITKYHIYNPVFFYNRHLSLNCNALKQYMMMSIANDSNYHVNINID